MNILPIIFTALFWIVMACIVYFDARRLRAAVDEEDVEKAAKIPEPGTWLMITFFLGCFALPVYMWKTRGPIGLLWAFLIWMGFAVLQVAILVVTVFLSRAQAG